jgi:16S rRNA processing protein RimM
MGPSLLQVDVADVRAQGQRVIALLEGYEDRDNARELLGSDILIRRNQLPPVAEDEHYWIDLLGMEVVTTQGVALGAVSEILETGAHDVLVVKGEQEHLIPFVKGVYIVSIDKAHRRIEVDWDPDF